MTGPLYTIARWCLGILPVDAAGRRVFDETLADWRKEASRVSGFLDGLVVSVRALWSVVRCVALVSARDVRSRDGAAVLLRLAAWSVVCMAAYVAFNWNLTMQVEGARVAVGPTGPALLSVSWVLTLMPLVAFASSAYGRHHPGPFPRLGPALVVGAVMFAATGWAMPAANHAYREFTFSLWSSGHIEPGMNERSIAEIVGMLFDGKPRGVARVLNFKLVLMVAVPVMLALGTTTRSLRGWRRVAGTVLPVPTLVMTGLVGINRFGELAWWPALLAAILVTGALVIGTDRAGDVDHDGRVSPDAPA